MSRDQALIDALQASIPRAQLALSSLQRTHDDVAAVLDSLATAVQLLRPPSPDHPRERHLTSLGAAVVRSGKTFAEVGFLAGIPEQRLRHLAAGAKPTEAETAALLRTLPDWKADARA